MAKQILIIGGGISGLAVLHYLIQKYADRPDVEILLLEKDAAAGGTIHSIVRNGCLFETGPNGFLDSKPRTLEFIAELGLVGELVKANRSSQIRYICLDNKLHIFPTSPGGFLGFKPMCLKEKLRVLGEFFIPPGKDADESVYAFGARRLGEKFSKLFLDPMVSGIYGGNARETVLRAAFPKIYALEQKHGSLFKVMFKTRKNAKINAKNREREGFVVGNPMGTLTSFGQGQEQMIFVLSKRYHAHIRFNQEVRIVKRTNGRFSVTCADAAIYEADELFVCAPAYQAASFLEGMSPELSLPLAQIHYSPMVVVGLVFERKVFPSPPVGFGYLIPSSENKKVLGILWDGNIFKNRSPEDKIMMRVMIGGARHLDILSMPRDELIEAAMTEVRETLGLAVDAAAVETFYVQWPMAIPQYDRACVLAETKIAEELQRHTGLYLVANYRKGVSLNDCIENAWQAARSSSI